MNLKTEIQNKCLEIRKENNYHGTIVLDMGTGKTKHGIDCIKESNSKNVLITYPRILLKKSWINEINIWGLSSDVNLKFGTIHTACKLSKEELSKFDMIICDEIHEMATPKYGKLMTNALELNIPIIGLTGTPSLKDKFKEDFYSKYCPILYEYYDSAQDGLINKRRYFIYEYELNDNYKVDVKTKTNIWQQGELSRYNYIQSLFDSSKLSIETYYFNQVKSRTKIHLNKDIRLSYKRFLNHIVSKDLIYFRNIYWNGMKKKKLPYDLYKILRNIADEDYAKFGMKAEYYASKAPDEVKSTFYKYVWARNERKSFLANLNSSANIALEIKKRILAKYEIIDDKPTYPNKVLLFSELTSQAEKLSKFSIHSNNNKKDNERLLELFNNNEIRELSSVKSLTLGLNLTKPNWAILESYNSSDTQGKQKLGRTNRLDIDNVANVVIIVPKNTQAEEWFNVLFKTLKSNDVEINYIKSIEELTYN